MKKFISLMAATAMCATTVTVPLSANAEGEYTDIHEAIVDLFKNGETAGDYNVRYDSAKDYLVQDVVNVPANMQVRKNGEAQWKEGFANDYIFIANGSGPIKAEDDQKLDYRTYVKMSEVKKIYDEYIKTAKSYINLQTNKDALQAQLDDVKVTGSFNVTIKFDATSPSMYNEVKALDKDAFQGMFKLAKWDDATKDYANETDLNNLYTVTSVTPNDENKEVVVAVDVVDNAKQDKLNTYLAYDIILQKDALTAEVGTKGNTYTTIGTVTGYTDIVMSQNEDTSVAADKTVAHITYATKQDSDVKSDVSTKVEVVYATPEPDQTPVPTKRPGSGGGSSGGPAISPNATPVPTVAPTVTPMPEDMVVETPDKFDAENHYEYIIGYDDGTVKPEGNITREEVATIFYRMLKADVRKNMFTNENSFSDVSEDRWSNNAISTLTKGNVINGYDDGRFRPSANITRAEFVTIASRFYKTVNFKGSDFSDISGHWAEINIQNAVYYKLISGYADGTFKPNANITRAEVMVIVNNILNRKVDAAGLAENTPQWSDNVEGAWYYYDVLEATRPHEYVRRNEGGVVENWTALSASTDWESLEKSWTVGDEVDTVVDDKTEPEGDTTKTDEEANADNETVVDEANDNNSEEEATDNSQENAEADDEIVDDVPEK